MDSKQEIIFKFKIQIDLTTEKNKADYAKISIGSSGVYVGLVQVGTYIALRLTNSSDQSIVKSSAPDNLVSLIDLLPSLRTDEAIVTGEAIKIPTRVRIELNNPRPTSNDPDLVTAWGKEYPEASDDYKTVVTKIRQRKF